MNIPFNLDKAAHIGKLCKRSALVVGGVGLTQIVLTCYAIWQQYQAYQAQFQLYQQQQPQQELQIQASSQISSLLLYGGTQVFTDIITTLTFSLILYVIGVGICTFSRSESSETEIVYENIDDDNDGDPFEEGEGDIDKQQASHVTRP